MNIIIEPNAKKELKRLPQKEIAIILKKIYSIKDSPLQHLERLKGLKLWKLRIGDYRAFINADTGKNNLYVLKIRHRKEVYKDLK